MILIVEMIYAILLHLACIGVFLAFLVIILIFGEIDTPDGFILLSAVRLPWNRYHAGINYWSFRGRKTIWMPRWSRHRAVYRQDSKPEQTEKECDPGSETQADR